MTNQLNAQNVTRQIEGKWEVCTSLRKLSIENCRNFVTYHFKKDGTYDDSREYIILGATYKYHGKWLLNNKKMTIDVEDENGMSIPPQKFKIKWLEEKIFYSVGREGFFGPKVFTIYKLIE